MLFPDLEYHIFPENYVIRCKKALEPVFTTALRCLNGLFPAILRRFPLQSVRIARESSPSIQHPPVMDTGSKRCVRKKKLGNFDGEKLIYGREAQLFYPPQAVFTRAYSEFLRASWRWILVLKSTANPHTLISWIGSKAAPKFYRFRITTVPGALSTRILCSSEETTAFSVWNSPGRVLLT